LVAVCGFEQVCRVALAIAELVVGLSVVLSIEAVYASETYLLHVERCFDLGNVDVEVVFERLDVYRLSDTACHLETGGLVVTTWQLCLAMVEVVYGGGIDAESKCRGPSDFEIPLAAGWLEINERAKGESGSVDGLSPTARVKYFLNRLIIVDESRKARLEKAKE
jgi:hypothetical protein